MIKKQHSSLLGLFFRRAAPAFGDRRGGGSRKRGRQRGDIFGLYSLRRSSAALIGWAEVGKGGFLGRLVNLRVGGVGVDFGGAHVGVA